MAERFDDLIVWQKSRILVRDIYSVTSQGAFARDYDLTRQIRRAAISIASNIAEGVERYGSNELAHFLSIAKGSSSEIRAQLYLALDLAYIDKPTFDRLFEQCNEV